MATLHAGWISPVHRRECLPRRAKLNSDGRSGDQTRHTTVIAGMRDQQQTAERMPSEQQRGEQVRVPDWDRVDAVREARVQATERTWRQSRPPIAAHVERFYRERPEAGNHRGGRGSSRLGRKLCAARRMQLGQPESSDGQSRSSQARHDRPGADHSDDGAEDAKH
jgi:hypothetical protein